MATQKAEKARAGGHYQPASSPVRRLLFDPSEPESEQYRGLEVYARMKIPMGVYFQAAEPVTAGDPNYWTKVKRRHADFGRAALVSWNLTYPEGHEQAGEPVPCTAEGYMDLDIDLAVAIRNAWFFTLRTPVEDASPLAFASPSSATDR